MENWIQGKYTVINRSKYVGNKNPEFKSSLERDMMRYCDSNVMVKRWAYEWDKITIKYFLPIDGKFHTYYPDFFVEVLDVTGKTKKYIVEVKVVKEIPEDYLKEMYGYRLNDPEFKRNLLKEPKRKTTKAKENFNRSRLTVVKNKCKFDATKEFCKEHDFIFKIVTQNEISKLF